MARSPHRCIICPVPLHALLWAAAIDVSSGELATLIDHLGYGPIESIRAATDTERTLLDPTLAADRVLWVSLHRDRPVSA